MHKNIRHATRSSFGLRQKLDAGLCFITCDILHHLLCLVSYFFVFIFMSELPVRNENNVNNESNVQVNKNSDRIIEKKNTTTFNQGLLTPNLKYKPVCQQYLSE